MIVTWNPDYWRAALAVPLEDRLAPATREAVSHVGLINAATHVACQPQSAQAPANLVADVRAALMELPRPVRDRLDGVLLGVHFARGLGSSGVTDIVADANGAVLGVVTLIDIGSFADRTANAWATWKENMPFRSDERSTLQAVIERPADDDCKNALQYLLLHEFGHTLTVDSAFLPNWWIKPDKYKQNDAYSFLPLSWQIAADGGIVPLPQNDFPQRSRLAYYRQTLLPGDELAGSYEALLTTDFVTLYASTNAYDDFAESFATYVHVVLMGKPFEIRLLRDGEVVAQSGDYWRSPRAAKKRAVLEDFLGRG